MDGDAALVNRIAGIFADMHVQVPSPATDLFGQGILDSLAFVELLGRLEQQFEMKCFVEQLDFDNFQTIAKIAGFVKKARSSV